MQEKCKLFEIQLIKLIILKYYIKTIINFHDTKNTMIF